MSEWISVEDELPAAYEQVKIQHAALGELRARLSTGTEGSVWWAEEWGYIPLWRVSHWQPLSDPQE